MKNSLSIQGFKVTDCQEVTEKVYPRENNLSLNRTFNITEWEMRFYLLQNLSKTAKLGDLAHEQSNILWIMQNSNIQETNQIFL